MQNCINLTRKFVVIHDSPLAKWMTQDTPALRKRPPTNAKGFPDFPDRLVKRFPITKEILIFCAKRLFTREWAQLELSLTGLPYMVPIFFTDANGAGIPHPTKVPEAERFFHKNGASYAEEKLVNISIYASFQDGPLDQHYMFGRVESAENWDPLDYDLTSRDGITVGETDFPRSFYDPRLPTGPRQHYEEWLQGSRLTNWLRMSRVRDMREKIRSLVLSLNRRGIMAIFWCYTTEASLIMMRLLDVETLDGTRDKAPGLNRKFVLLMFDTPTDADLRLLSNRYCPEVNKKRWAEPSSFSNFEPSADDLLDRLFPRAVTAIVTLDNAVRPMLLMVPTMNEAFMAKGPWLQSMLCKGALKTDWDETLLVDQFIAARGPNPIAVPHVDDVIRSLQYPQTKLPNLDPRREAAEEVVMMASLARGQDRSAEMARLLKMGTFKEPTADLSKSYVARWHGRLEFAGPFSFFEMSRLPICCPFPIGRGNSMAGAQPPRRRTTWGLGQRESLPEASALTELARPWRSSTDPTWQEKKEAKYFHPDSHSSLTLILSQAFAALRQLEKAKGKEGRDVTVSILPSAKIVLGATKGATARNCSWDWASFWGLHSGFAIQARRGLFEANHYSWLNTDGRYLAASTRRMMEANGRSEAFAGLIRPFVHSLLWLVWSPKIATRLPLQASVALALKHARTKSRAAAQCWKEKSHSIWVSPKWLLKDAPIHFSAPLIFTPQVNGKIGR